MINKERANKTVNKIVDVINELRKLPKNEVLYIKAATEIKLKLDELESRR